MLLHLFSQASRRVDDLFEDLRDGHNLLSLLEVLSGEHLVRLSDFMCK